MEQFNLVLTDGGMGDLICKLVSVDWCLKSFPNIYFYVWIPDYLVDFANHVVRPGNRTINPFSKREKFKKTLQGHTTEWNTSHTAIRTHPVDYGFHMLADRHIYDLNEKNYLSIRPQEITVPFRLPEKYVVFQCTGVEPVRTMPASTANELIAYVREKGYQVVFLGKEKNICGFKNFSVESKPIEIDYTRGINLLNLTDVLQSAAIIAGACAYIGMDSGLTHLAGCTDTPIICGYTASHPSHIAPIRHGSQSYKFCAILPDPHPNAFYQTHSSFKKGNFQRFDGWQTVVNSITPDKFIKELEKIL